MRQESDACPGRSFFASSRAFKAYDLGATFTGMRREYNHQSPGKQRTRQFEFSRTREKSRSRTSRLICSNPVSGQLPVCRSTRSESVEQRLIHLLPQPKATKLSRVHPELPGYS